MRMCNSTAIVLPIGNVMTDSESATTISY